MPSGEALGLGDSYLGLRGAPPWACLEASLWDWSRKLASHVQPCQNSHEVAILGQPGVEQW